MWCWRLRRLRSRFESIHADMVAELALASSGMTRPFGFWLPKGATEIVVTTDTSTTSFSKLVVLGIPTIRIRVVRNLAANKLPIRVVLLDPPFALPARTELAGRSAGRRGALEDAIGICRRLSHPQQSWGTSYVRLGSRAGHSRRV